MKVILKAKQYKLVKLQSFDSSYFCGKSHFKVDAIQNYLVIQPMYCEKLIDDDNEKDRYHCHVTGKFIGAAKEVAVIFHNLRGYESHLIFCELKKFDVKIDPIPNGLEKYVLFILNKT